MLPTFTPSDSSQRFAGSTVSAVARLYHAPLNGSGDATNDWTYSQLKGLVVFGCDPSSTADLAEQPEYWFRIVDQRDNKLLWIFKVPSGMAFSAERPYFWQTFEGRSRRFGLLFENDVDAVKFYEAVRSKVCHSSSTKRRKSTSSIRSLISTPDPESFVHKSHVAVKSGGIVEVDAHLDPIWRRVLLDMQRNKRASSNSRTSASSRSTPSSRVPTPMSCERCMHIKTPVGRSPSRFLGGFLPKTSHSLWKWRW